MRHLVELFLFFTVLMALPDWYIYRTYILRLKKQVWRRLYWIPSILIFIGMLIAFHPSFSSLFASFLAILGDLS